jgi:hypothetical protein
MYGSCCVGVGVGGDGDGDGAAGADARPMLGKRPPAVGGAVTSLAACSYDSAVGTGGAIILVNMIPMPVDRKK